MVYFLLNNRIKLIIYLINLTTLLFIFRASIPSFKYPFIILYLVCFIYLVKEKCITLKKIKRFLKFYLLIIILLLIFLIAIYVSYKLYLEIFKDLLNSLVLLSILFFYTSFIKSKRIIKLCLINLAHWILYFSVFIALYWIYDFFHIYTSNSYRSDESFIIDYNFAIIPALFGIVSVLLLFTKVELKGKQYFLSLILLILYLQIFLSSSRRGFIVAISILILVYIVFILSSFIKKVNFVIFAKKTRVFIISLSTLFIIIYFAIYYTSFDFRINLLSTLGIKFPLAMQEEITSKCYRYIKIFSPNENYFDFYNEIWVPKYDPYNPDSGWGTRIHKTISPLTGINSDIVPDKAKGYLMDSTCNADSWGGDAFSPTFVGLFSNNVENNDTIEISVFCFVSNDFNGDWAGVVLTNNDGPWIGTSFYNMEKKGTWQKLITKRTVSSGFVSGILYFAKLGVKNFSSLKGYVIFAYPKLSKFNNDSVKVNETSLLELNSSINRSKRNNSSNVIINKEFINYTKNIRKIDYLKPSKYIYSSFTTLPFFSENIYYNSRYDKDPIRNWVAKFISEDTTYYACKSSITVIKGASGFGTDRTSRWQFALQVFNIEYNWKQKIFGGGFAFLNWYGYYFSGDKTKSDYPHNPFLYILLYSGIIGLSFYIYLLYKVFYYYIKYIKEFYLFFIFFLITYFFTFFGGGNPFNPPIMGFFMMLPFFIHYIHQKDKSEDKADGAKCLKEKE